MASRGYVLRSKRLDVILDVKWQNKSKTVPKLDLGTTSGYVFTEISDLIVVLGWESGGGGSS